jgi:hypothetical protein
MVRFFNSVSSTLGGLWCQAMHSDAMWPVKGEYQCRTCLRKYKVAWEPSATPCPDSSVKLKTAPAQRISTVEARII